MNKTDRDLEIIRRVDTQMRILGDLLDQMNARQNKIPNAELMVAVIGRSFEVIGLLLYHLQDLHTKKLILTK